MENLQKFYFKQRVAAIDEAINDIVEPHLALRKEKVDAKKYLEGQEKIDEKRRNPNQQARSKQRVDAFEKALDKVDRDVRAHARIDEERRKKNEKAAAQVEFPKKNKNVVDASGKAIDKVNPKKKKTVVDASGKAIDKKIDQKRMKGHQQALKMDEFPKKNDPNKKYKK